MKPFSVVAGHDSLASVKPGSAAVRRWNDAYYSQPLSTKLVSGLALVPGVGQKLTERLKGMCFRYRGLELPMVGIRPLVGH